MLTQIKGAIFDMDGTLIDSLMVWDVIWDAFGKQFLGGKKFPITDADDKAIRTMTLQDGMEYLHTKYGIGKDGAELLDAANTIILDFYANEVELKDGVLEFLEYCRSNGIKMCVASATALPLIHIAMEHCQIKEYFTDVLSCAEIGKGKDEPDIYMLAQSRLGTSTEETCVFEDSHIAIATADRLGMKTVGIYDKYNFGQEEIKKIATVYIAEGETLQKLI